MSKTETRFIVESKEKDHIAVKPEVSGTCSGCSACVAKVRKLKTQGLENFREGDRLILSLEKGALLKNALLCWGLPLGCMLAGAFASSFLFRLSDGVSAAISLALAFPAWVVLKIASGKIKNVNLIKAAEKEKDVSPSREDGF